MINNDIPLVHKVGLSDKVKLNKSFSSHHKKSLSDISGEFCINFSNLPISWHESGHISRNASSNSLASVRTESQISNITGFEDEINELKHLSQNNCDDNDETISQKISDLNAELKIKNLELDELSELRRDYQSNLIKIQCQESVIISLKDQILEQFCVIQEYKQREQIHENTIQILNNEINVAKKSEIWFKDEFHQAQEDKLSLQNRLIHLENLNLDLKIFCNKLKNNIQLVQINSNYIEEKSKREKELLINKLTDYDTEIGNQVEFDIIKLELTELQNKFVEQNTFIDNLTVENDRITRLLTESNNTVANLNIKLQQIERIGETKIQQLDKLSQENSTLIEINAKLETDKIEINKSIKKLKNDFDLIQTHFLNQKQDLETKDTELNELRSKCLELVAKKFKYETKSTNTDHNNSPGVSNVLLIKNESDDVKKLKILVRVLENEYKVKIKRFETNIRLLLKKIKENFRIRKHLESKYEHCNESNKSLVAEKNEIIMNLIKIKSLNFNNHNVNLMPNLKNYINLFVDEFNKLFDINKNYLIELNSHNSIISSLNCSLASLTERQEKLQIEFSQKEQMFAYELNSYRNQLNTISETLRTSHQMVGTLTHSKQELLKEIDQLNFEIKNLIEDKNRLKNLNSEFKENLNVLMDHNQRTSSATQKNPRIDYKKINDLLTKSNRSNNRKPLEPLKTCVDLLRSDMEKLNLIIKNNSSVRYELSLMDELKHAHDKFN